MQRRSYGDSASRELSRSQDGLRAGAHASDLFCTFPGTRSLLAKRNRRAKIQLRTNRSVSRAFFFFFFCPAAPEIGNVRRRAFKRRSLRCAQLLAIELILFSYWLAASVGHASLSRSCYRCIPSLFCKCFLYMARASRNLAAFIECSAWRCLK